MLIFLLSSASRFVSDIIATNFIVLITANLPVVLGVQMVLVVNEVVKAAVIKVLLILLELIASVTIVTLMLHIRHLVALSAIVKEDWVRNRPLALAFERWQVL